MYLYLILLLLLLLLLHVFSLQADFSWSIKAENDSAEWLGSGERQAFTDKSFYVLDDDYAIARTYRCVANNTVGPGTFCEIEVAGKCRVERKNSPFLQYKYMRSNWRCSLIHAYLQYVWYCGHLIYGIEMFIYGYTAITFSVWKLWKRLPP